MSKITRIIYMVNVENKFHINEWLCILFLFFFLPFPLMHEYENKIHEHHNKNNIFFFSLILIACCKTTELT